ncbi:MAG TPA: hypothetical protein VFO55_12340 [Gemmatimonadaceae bacterium]|nr:hypothetical protein [Gemmatimonadaceae bacterium]
MSACSAERAVAPGLFTLEDEGSGQWRTVSTGAEHSCALDARGRAWCWGSNASFQLGVDLTPSKCGTAPEVDCSLIPAAVMTGRAFTAISAGGAHTCAITTDSVPFCWGSNREGQLGVFGASTPVARLPGTVPMISISAGSTHTCGIRADDLLVCWGSNQFGAVGAGAGHSVPPTIVGGNQRFASVQASNQRTCARTMTGRVLCWGVAWSHSSGDTNFVSIRSTLTLVPGLGSMAAVGVGPSSTCSLDATGFAWCWESNLNGESGTGPGPGSQKPRRIGTDVQLSALTVGGAHACAIAVDGPALCWGSNRHGQVGALTDEFCGVSRSACATHPVAVAGRQRFISLSAGLGNHVCGISERFNLYCWGAGTFGQRGDSSRTSRSRVPRLAVFVHPR